MQHRVRDLLIRQRTQAINALRSHLAELGIVAAQGDEASSNQRKPVSMTVRDEVDGASQGI